MEEGQLIDAAGDASSEWQLCSTLMQGGTASSKTYVRAGTHLTAISRVGSAMIGNSMVTCTQPSAKLT